MHDAVEFLYLIIIELLRFGIDCFSFKTKKNFTCQRCLTVRDSSLDIINGIDLKRLKRDFFFQELFQNVMVQVECNNCNNKTEIQSLETIYIIPDKCLFINVSINLIYNSLCKNFDPENFQSNNILSENNTEIKLRTLFLIRYNSETLHYTFIRRSKKNTWYEIDSLRPNNIFEIKFDKTLSQIIFICFEKVKMN